MSSPEDRVTLDALPDLQPSASYADPFGPVERVEVPSLPALVRELLAEVRSVPGATHSLVVRPPRAPKGACFPYLGDYVVDEVKITRTMPPGWRPPEEYGTALAAIQHGLEALGPDAPFAAVHALACAAFALRRVQERARRERWTQETICRAGELLSEPVKRARKLAKDAIDAYDAIHCRERRILELMAAQEIAHAKRYDALKARAKAALAALQANQGGPRPIPEPAPVAVVRDYERGGRRVRGYVRRTRRTL